MSRRSAVIIAVVLAFAARPVAHAQDRGDPSPEPKPEEMIAAQRAELRLTLNQSEDCATDEMQPDTIVVCRDISAAEEETEEVMSVLPRPVASDRRLIPDLREPPCWVTGKWPCARIGSVRPPAYMVDLDSIPEALTEEEAALVFAVEDLPLAAGNAESEEEADPETERTVPAD